nr:uncharacterized protein LOC104114067 isoform X1 [Ipomoea batatas]
MAGRYGSLSRALLSTARTATPRSTPSISLLRSPTLLGQRLQSRRLLSGILPRTNGILGCTESLLQLHSALAAARLTSHIEVEARSCCELSQGTFFCRTCPDRYLKFIAVDVSKQTLQ